VKRKRIAYHSNIEEARWKDPEKKTKWKLNSAPTTTTVSPYSRHSSLTRAVRRVETALPSIY
jgi:hypothetical protein